MITNFYPPYLRQLFTNRARELDFLQSMVTDLLAGKPRRLAVWGLRRVGKTLVIQEQIARMLDQGAAPQSTWISKISARLRSYLRNAILDWSHSGRWKTAREM